ncbi:AraC family transcriptional regulator [Cohnella thailandensis]|uniref:AraC family transcriptional regulator n=1 Tax=Cohnella thailandensis TaxID=557557 RepID=A0A841STS4_9BACL|nr:AraC family transcriptional regulator [Cohnella thailandensis]MBB6635723.1 AraC family transcriptional regulator [Cohnella thailandensis]MBP1976099.1 AraC-like DNA-binding protein [Cohnella thailandensis]
MNGERRLKIRFFMSLTLISICSVLVLATALFFWFRGKTVDYVNKANDSVLLNTETVFAKYMESVQNYTLAFYRHPNINSVMQSGDSSWSDQLFSALSQIKGTLTVNPYLENAYIMGKDGPVMMFENSPLSEASKRELFERVRDGLIKESPFVWNATLNNGAPVTVMMTYYNDKVYADSEYTGAIAIMTNLGKLQENIFTNVAGGDTRYAVLSSEGGVLMQSNPFGAEYEDELLQRIVRGSRPSGTLIWKTDDGRKELITYRLSPGQNLWFLSETSYRNSVRDISNAMTLMIALCVGLAAVASGVAAFVSHRMYKPIGTLFGHIRSLSGERLSLTSAGGFEEANRELERIAGRFGELKRENEDSALLSWLTTPYRSGEELPSALPLLKNSSGHAAFFVAVLQLEAAYGDGGTSSDAADRLDGLKGLPRVIEGLFEGTCACRGFFPNPGTAVLIVSEAREGSFGDQGISRERWEQLEQSVRAWPGTRCHIAISRLSDDPSQLKAMYEEARDGMQYLKFQYGTPIVYAEEAALLSDEAMPDDALEKVLQVVRDQKHEMIPRAVERVLAEAGGYRAEKATVALSRLASDLSAIAESGVAGGHSRHADFLEHYQRIWSFSSYEELRAWFEQLCFRAYEMLKARNAVQTRDVAGEAIAYIRKHFADPTLSLNLLADKLAISPPYLSRLITESTGSSFPDFVNLVRLEHARELLVSELEMDIRAIAEKSGYGSSTYFTTLFKKRYGMTPTKWRLNHIVQHGE